MEPQKGMVPFEVLRILTQRLKKGTAGTPTRRNHCKYSLVVAGVL